MMNGNQLATEIDNAIQAIVPTLSKPMTAPQRLALISAMANAIVSHIQVNATVSGTANVTTAPGSAPFTGATIS